MNGLHGIDYRDGEVALRGELALPTGDGPHPGVLVLHSGLGMADDVRGHARRLADNGYAAMVADMFASRGATLEPAIAGERMVALQAEPGRLRRRAQAAVEALVAQPAVDGRRLAAIGFCFGGQCALELARSGAELRAFVSYHGLLTTAQPAERGAVRGEVAIFTGARDPLAPAEHVEAVRQEFSEAGAHWQVTVYGDGWHGFMDDYELPRYDWIRYDPALHAQAWAATLALLAATLGSDLPPDRQFAHDARTPTAIH